MLLPLFSRVLNNGFSAWAEDFQVYNEGQAGSRKEMGTIDNILFFIGWLNTSSMKANDFMLLL